MSQMFQKNIDEMTATEKWEEEEPEEPGDTCKDKSMLGKVLHR